MEDRFSAIRAAIGTAQAGDVVVLAGRGQSDFVEHMDEEVGMGRGAGRRMHCVGTHSSVC